MRFALLFVLLGLTSQSYSEAFNLYSPIAIELIGPEEQVSFPPKDLINVPDGNIAFIKIDNLLRLWTQGVYVQQEVRREGTYFFTGTNFMDLMPHPLQGHRLLPVLEPSGAGFDKDYAGGSAIVHAKNSTQLLMIYHGENYDCGRDKTKAGIGLAISGDGGLSWDHRRQIISGSELPTDCNYIGFRGAGNPSAIYRKDSNSIYIYFNEWPTAKPASICVARGEIGDSTAPKVWEKYKDGFFSTTGIGGSCDPVITPLDRDAGYAGSVNVTFNSFLGLYLAVFVSHNGFYFTTSLDGVHWGVPKRFWAVLAKSSPNLKLGESWYAYPTLISPNEDTSNTTSKTGYLYYAKGVQDSGLHRMYRRRFEIAR